MGPSPAAPAAALSLDGVLQRRACSVLSFRWLCSINPGLYRAVLEIVYCNVAPPRACVWFRFPPCQLLCTPYFHTVSPYIRHPPSPVVLSLTNILRRVSTLQDALNNVITTV
ncbi:hypothetical protein ARMSODRAFT_367679 [Armillaria solidipes]|uniref:Uncharacterized protein n=1 Tax=Armillaria solidipes TaxID=1076256 RepID=A0A2H3BQB4_9AGAR|nr:hypothetical protein ARMSODRAFT_367679 [Armillaria solidipes]